MQAIIVATKKSNILNQIDLGNILENVKPETFKGQETHNYLVEYFNKENELSITSVAQISALCQRMTEDASVYAIGEKITETLSTSLDSLLIYTFEGIQNKIEDGDKIAESLNDKLISLLEMESLTEQQKAIRGGLLNPYQTIHEGVGMIRKMCEIKTGTQTSTSVFEAYHPITYTEGTPQGLFIKLHGVTFGINESQVYPTKHIPSQRFENLSNAVSELKYNPKNESFIYENRTLGKFEISKDAITHKDAVVYESNNEFTTKLGMIVESVSDNQRERNNYRSILESLLSVKLNFDSFTQCDNIVVVENKQNGEKFGIFVMENKSYVAILKSVRYPQSVTEFGSVNEAIEHGKQKIGYDFSNLMEKFVIVEKAKLEQKEVVVESYNKLLNGLEERKQIIKSEIAICEQNGQKETFDALQEALNLVDALIVEQKQNFEKEILG